MDGGMGVKKKKKKKNKKNGWSLSEQCWRWRYHRLHGIFFYCKSLNFQFSCFSFTVQYPIFFLVLPVQSGKLRYKKRYEIAVFLYWYWLHWYIWWRERTRDATVKGECLRLFLVFSKKYWWNHDLQIARYRNRNEKLLFLKRENLLIQKRNPTNFAQPNIFWFMRFDKRAFSSLNTPKQTGSI